MGRSPGGGHGNPLQYSCLEHPHGQETLAGYSPWGRRDAHTTSISRLQFFSFASADPKIPGAQWRHCLSSHLPVFRGKIQGGTWSPSNSAFIYSKPGGRAGPHLCPPLLSHPPLSAPASSTPSSLSRDEGQRSQVLGKKNKSGLNFPKSELTIFLLEMTGNGKSKKPRSF